MTISLGNLETLTLLGILRHLAPAADVMTSNKKNIAILVLYLQLGSSKDNGSRTPGSVIAGSIDGSINGSRNCLHQIGCCHSNEFPRL